jgi:type VI protein secretion system component VasK
MEEIRLLLLIASLIILAGLFEITNLEIESYEILTLNTSIISIVLGIILILICVYVIWKRWKPIEIQKEILEKGSKEALKEVSAKLEHLKTLISKPSKRNLSTIKKEIKNLKFYKGIVSKILGENSEIFYKLINEIEKTNSLNKIKKLSKKIEEILG